jgi:hypothetical protein
MVMVVDMSIGRIDQELQQRVTVNDIAAGAEVRGEEKEAQECHAPEESPPTWNRMIVETSSHGPCHASWNHGRIAMGAPAPDRGASVPRALSPA